MPVSPLSFGDQRLIELLYEARVLYEKKLEFDLSKTLVVTDLANPNPEISVNTQVEPAQILRVLHGGCALHTVTSNVNHEERRERIIERMKTLLFGSFIQTIALVAAAPSLDPPLSLVDTIDYLRSAEEYVCLMFGKKLQVYNFICVKFPDNRTYTLQINTPEFHAWYNDYERDVLGRDDRAVEDDSDGIDGRSGMTIP
ncbi:MAG: hypothetical protein NTX72_03490 [Candidatus Uhrbacteria bacterium]|nr:hypothetical protein [Candidatus Uhrbacteria bacterium]